MGQYNCYNAGDNLKKSAVAAIGAIFDLEPLILDDDGDTLTLIIQPDGKGEEGDVRDILIVRSGIKWEVGLSLKHNHFAVKHSRLAKNLDFGKRWFGKQCSYEYWNEIKPVFDYLQKEKDSGINWDELPSKEKDVYVPLLNAFISEINRSTLQDNTIPKKMVEYLLGEYDFYKVVSIDKSKIAQVLTFNLHDTLNKRSKKNKPAISVPKASLPTRIINIGIKPNSNNTVELYMDGGWQFSFRIHNASTKVETSLKFDIQIVGMPTTVISINCLWK